MLGLRDDWDALTTRIERRAARMWEQGLLEEVTALDAAGLRRGRTASRAIGYSQALAELDGRITREEAIAQTAQATRRYARRQGSWWRPDHRVEWLDAADPGLAEAAITRARGRAQHQSEWAP